MARIAREIERDEVHFAPMIDMNMVSVNHEITAQLARSAVRACTNLPVRYVVLDTLTGRTGRYLAAFRGRKSVLAVCYCRHAQRILALSYGVVPILRDREPADRYHFLSDALDYLDRRAELADDDLLAVVGGSFGPEGGASYVELATAARASGAARPNSGLAKNVRCAMAVRGELKEQVARGGGVEHGREGRLGPCCRWV